MYSYQFKEASPFTSLKFSFLEFLTNLSERDIYSKRLMANLSPDINTAIKTITFNLGLELNIVTTSKIVDHKEWWYKLEPLSQDDINYYLPLLILELSLYSKNFFQKLNLKRIILSNSITFNTLNLEEYRAALPDYDYDTRALVFSARERSLDYIRRVIHHCIFDYYYFVDHGTFHEKDSNWEHFNPKGFYYGNKETWNENDLIYDDYKSNDCFVSSYSKISLENDRSDVYSFLITSGLDVYDLGTREGIIGKCIIIKKMLAEFDKEDFSIGRNDFWYKARLFKKEICDVYYPKI